MSKNFRITDRLMVVIFYVFSYFRDDTKLPDGMVVPRSKEVKFPSTETTDGKKLSKIHHNTKKPRRYDRNR